MRIAYVYDAVYPWETGGVQKRVWELSRRLADRHDVHWYGLKYWDGPATIEREGVVIHGVRPAETLYVDGRRSIREALSFSANLLRPLLAEEFDVVDCQQFPYFPCFPSKLHSELRDTALVVTWHEVWGDYWYDSPGLKGLFGKAVERLVADGGMGIVSEPILSAVAAGIGGGDEPGLVVEVRRVSRGVPLGPDRGQDGGGLQGGSLNVSSAFENLMKRFDMIPGMGLRGMGGMSESAAVSAWGHSTGPCGRDSSGGAGEIPQTVASYRVERCRPQRPGHRTGPGLARENSPPAPQGEGAT